MIWVPNWDLASLLEWCGAQIGAFWSQFGDLGAQIGSIWIQFRDQNVPLGTKMFQFGVRRGTFWSSGTHINIKTQKWQIFCAKTSEKGSQKGGILETFSTQIWGLIFKTNFKQIFKQKYIIIMIFKKCKKSKITISLERVVIFKTPRSFFNTFFSIDFLFKNLVLGAPKITFFKQFLVQKWHPPKPRLFDPKTPLQRNPPRTQ